MLPFFWLSFADPEKPKGTQFLGAAVVHAPEFLLAVRVARLLGCNPGGEVQGMEIPDDYTVPPEFTYKLLSKADVDRLDAVMDGATKRTLN